MLHNKQERCSFIKNAVVDLKQISYKLKKI